MIFIVVPSFSTVLQPFTYDTARMIFDYDLRPIVTSIVPIVSCAPVSTVAISAIAATTAAIVSCPMISTITIIIASTATAITITATTASSISSATITARPIAIIVTTPLANTGPGCTAIGIPTSGGQTMAIYWRSSLLSFRFI